ncbi:putative gamma-glutamylcyclotransferase At3g02910 [Vitis riparia]|uniref:putative gamma-glutamylcyclotransferase At3g02910 n=1 Tax=Vitis riparia TaxID=96939 RepID=UPI00155A5B45|nr:putative gamma-glutamylcyclotransferase At3g02910 [Vitis riparia]
MGAEEDRFHSLVFTYGTLKRGFSNHVLIQDLIATGDATFVAVCRTTAQFPLVCGPYRVPFLINLPGSGHRVSGELYAVSARGLGLMDELEGTSHGHYERLPIEIEEAAGDGERRRWVEAYFAHNSYAAELWRKSGERGYSTYSEKEATGYVKRKDRPQNLSFLEQIRLFVASS